MKRMGFRKKRRFYADSRPGRTGVPVSWLLMIAGYLAGCLIGSIVAIKADNAWMSNLWQEPVDSSSADLLTALCSNGSYGFLLLLLATSYLGFFFVPGILSVKGFFSGSVFTAMLRSAEESAYYRAAAELLLPGVFLLPALLLLGQISMRASVRLFRCRAGEALPPGRPVSRPLAAVLILMLLASAMKTYAVPYLLGAL